LWNLNHGKPTKMIFDYKYKGFSKVQNQSSSTRMSFAPDASRKPTWFNGQLNNKLPFREAISALHSIVTSDLRYQPRDTTEYKTWLESQEEVWLAEFMQKKAADEQELKSLHEQLKSIDSQQRALMGPFFTAQSKYFQYLYKKNRDWWFVLDPVISVHPDEISFECFSLDESSYGRLACSHNVFDSLGDFSCGTTNIDYSAALYNEFQKIRDYKTTEFIIDPEGFSVETGADESFREVKIDLPDSWVRGFLQVSSAMTMNGHSFSLHPMDLHNLLFHLKSKKEKKGPRSLRFILKPGHPVAVSIDPWNTLITCPRSEYQGTQEAEIRIWGRRRLLTLERLLPIAKSIDVTLLGTGMPSFWNVQMPEMTFTLGLSGWTANDWSSSSNFDLLAPRAEVDGDTILKNTDSTHTLAALSIATQEGKVIYDANKKLWRSRELSGDALPLGELRYSNPREEKASEFFNTGAVSFQTTCKDDKRTLTGEVKDNDKVFHPTAVINSDERLVDGTCTCNFYSQNKFMKGPCEHILALRVAEARRF